MALTVLDRAKEQCTGSGSGDLTLTATGFLDFNLLSNQLADQAEVDVLLLDTEDATVGWEVLRCTFTLGTLVLARSTATVIASSNAGALTTLSANTHSVGIVNSSAVIANQGLLNASLDGMAYDKCDLTIVSDVGLQFDVEKIGGGDATFLINGVISILDCTTGNGVGGKARVALTEGSDANNPVLNYIYVTDTAGVATLNANSTLPTGAFGWVGKTLVPDATTWSTTGAYVLQRFTEAFSNDSRGVFSHEREKLRALGALYISGVSQTLNITTNGGVPDNVHLTTGSGQVYQLHRQDFPALTVGPYYYGNGQTPFGSISDLNEAMALQDGTAIGNNDRFNIVILGVVNVNSGECKRFINVSNDVYSTDSEALSDHGNSADYSAPDGLKSVTFLISRIALKYSTFDGGTWTELGVFSLLGTQVGARSGGSGAVASFEFDDSFFRVYDNVDSTKQVAFEIAGVTTGTTRTVTMPDVDVDLGYLATERVIAQSGALSLEIANDETVTLTTDNALVTVTVAVPATGKVTIGTLTILDGGAGNNIAFTGPVAGDWANGGNVPDLTANRHTVGAQRTAGGTYTMTHGAHQ